MDQLSLYTLQRFCLLPKSLCSNDDPPSQQDDLEALAASLQGVMIEGEDEDEGVEKDRETQHSEGEVSLA